LYSDEEEVFEMRSSFGFCAVALAAVAIAPAQSPYKIVPVVENGITPIPNSSETFAVDSYAGFSIDENYISFINWNGNSSDLNNGVWLYNLADNTFTQLVKVGDPAPGTGNPSLPFNNFGSYCLVKGLHVIFIGDSGGSGNPGGLYSVPVTGGQVQVVANQFIIPQPSQTLNTFQADDLHVVFAASPYTGGEGIYRADIAGGPDEMLRAIVPPNENLTPAGPCPVSPVDSFLEPRIAIEKYTNPIVENVVFLGSEGSEGGPFDILIRRHLTGEPTCLVDTIPNVTFDEYTQLAIDNEHVYIAAPCTTAECNAFNAGWGPAAYLYQVNFNGKGLKPLVRTNELPGLPGSLYSLGISAELGVVAIVATNSANTTELYAYQTSTKTFTPVIGNGDSVWGSTPPSSYPPVISLGWNAVSNGQIVFGWRDSVGSGIVVAEPVTPAQ
jgi:hypothetical protein